MEWSEPVNEADLLDVIRDALREDDIPYEALSSTDTQGLIVEADDRVFLVQVVDISR